MVNIVKHSVYCVSAKRFGFFVCFSFSSDVRGEQNTKYYADTFYDDFSYLWLFILYYD